MKLTKLEENYAFFYFAGKRIFFNIYDVIVKQKKNAPLFTTLSHTHTLQHTWVCVCVYVCVRVCVFVLRITDSGKEIKNTIYIDIGSRE